MKEPWARCRQALLAGLLTEPPAKASEPLWPRLALRSLCHVFPETKIQPGKTARCPHSRCGFLKPRHALSFMSLRGCNSQHLTFMGGFVLAKGFRAICMRDASLRPVRCHHPGRAAGGRAEARQGVASPAGLRGARSRARRCHEVPRPSNYTAEPIFSPWELSLPIFHVQPISGS